MQFPSLPPASVISAFSIASSRSNSRHPSEAASSRHSSSMSDDDLELSGNTVVSSLGDSSGSQFTSECHCLKAFSHNPADGTVAIHFINGSLAYILDCIIIRY